MAAPGPRGSGDNGRVRRVRRHLAVAAPLLAAALIASPLAGAGAGGGERKLSEVKWDKRVKAAKRVASKRQGSVSFSVRGGGEKRSHGGRETYKSASVVKAMLLAAYLRRYDDRDLTKRERRRLRMMTRRSDNETATWARDEVGNEGLERLADRVGMRCFATNPYSWGSTAICSRDMARLMKKLPELLPRRHRGWAMTQLRRIVRKQRWGIAEVSDWRKYFKGGWHDFEPGNWRVHQIALLRSPGGQELAVAILSDGQPSKGYGIETVRRVANQLIGPVTRR